MIGAGNTTEDLGRDDSLPVLDPTVMNRVEAGVSCGFGDSLQSSQAFHCSGVRVDVPNWYHGVLREERSKCPRGSKHLDSRDHDANH